MKTIALILLPMLAALSLGSESSVIVTEGLVNAPIDKVWEAFTTKEGIETWMVKRTEIELKVGAIWRTSYSKDSNLNDDAAIHHTILAFDPGRMLSFRTVRAPKSFPFKEAIAKTWCVVYFEPIGDKQTKVTLRMLGYDETEGSKKMKGFFEQGNKYTIDQLVKKYAK